MTLFQPPFKEGKTVKDKLSFLPSFFLKGTLLFFSFAFLDPHFFIEKKNKEKEAPQPALIPTEGIAIYLVLDQSGSMAGKIGEKEAATKMDLLKETTKDFVFGNQKWGLKGRVNDLLGIVTFARGAQVLVPLTLDHQAILDALNALNFTDDLTQDGTAIGYSIYKTTSLIAATRHYAEDLVGEKRPAYTIKNSVMVLVTDGLQAPNPLDKGKRLRNIDLIEAAEFAREQKVRLYIINVEPKMGSEEFSAHRSLMKKAADITGGQFYLADSSRGQGLNTIYSEIDQLEKSVLPIETRYLFPPKGELPHLFDRLSLYPYLIALGMVFLLASVVLDAGIIRRVP